MVLVELFAEKANWLCVGFPPVRTSHAEDGPLEDSEGHPGNEMQRVAWCSCCVCGDLWFLIIWKTKFQRLCVSPKLFFLIFPER